MSRTDQSRDRELRAISACNQTLLRADDEQVLLNDICRIVCDDTGYRMAWVGYAENDDAKTVRPVAWAGFEDGYLSEIGNLTWADTVRGRGPTGTAVRCGKTACVQDFDSDPDVVVWSRSAARRGFRCTIALPLKDAEGTAFGALSIYSSETNAFTAEEILLLEQLSADLAFGITVLRARAERRRTDAALHESRERLRAIIERAAVGIAQVDLEGRFLEVNDRFCELVGYDPDEMRALTFPEITHPDDVAEDLAWLERIRRGDADTYHAEKRYIAKSGESIWAEITVTLARDPNGKPDYTVLVVQDIGQRKSAEDALGRSARALRALSSVNESLVRATCESALLKDVCEAIVANQGYALAWVGYAGTDPARTVVPVAQAGPQAGLLKDLHVSWEAGPLGNGAIGRSIRQREAVVVRGMPADESMTPWGDIVRIWGLGSVVSLPLVGSDGLAYGAVAIYSQDVDSFHDDEVALLLNMAEDLSYGIEALRSRHLREEAESDLLQANTRLQAVLKSITSTMGRVVEARDPYTQGHQQGVASIAVMIAEEMGLPKDDREAIEIGALVHDLGKLGVPAEILTKPGVLSHAEFAIIKCHPQIGYDILKGIDFGVPVADIVLQHHERMDGSGYPNGLSGDDIPVTSRVLAVADTVEAMASHRPYRPALGLKAAVDEIKDHPEKYDPRVAAACVRLYEANRIDL
jgi:PAS domain S-box-containing protein